MKIDCWLGQDVPIDPGWVGYQWAWRRQEFSVSVWPNQEFGQQTIERVERS